MSSIVLTSQEQASIELLTLRKGDPPWLNVETATDLVHRRSTEHAQAFTGAWLRLQLASFGSFGASAVTTFAFARAAPRLDSGRI